MIKIEEENLPGYCRYLYSSPDDREYFCESTGENCVAYSTNPCIKLFLRLIGRSNLNLEMLERCPSKEISDFVEAKEHLS